MILNIIFNELTNKNFNDSFFGENKNITIIEKWTKFNLINAKDNKNLNFDSDIDQCLNELKEYYNIKKENNNIIMKIEIAKEQFEKKLSMKFLLN